MEENKTYTKEEINQILENSLDKFFPKDSTLRADFNKEVCNQFKELDGPDIDDLVIVDSYDWEPIEWVLSVTCPHCKNNNDIYRSEVPNKEFTKKCYFCDKSFRVQVK